MRICNALFFGWYFWILNRFETQIFLLAPGNGVTVFLGDHQWGEPTGQFLTKAICHDQCMTSARHYYKFQKPKTQSSRSKHPEVAHPKENNNIWMNSHIRGHLRSLLGLISELGILIVIHLKCLLIISIFANKKLYFTDYMMYKYPIFMEALGKHMFNPQSL